MVLDLQDKKLFKQKDVRETAGISGTPTIGDFTSSNHSHAAAGATGGTVDHANLTTIGTNSHSQIDTHIANTANPHSVILTDLASAGEGIDFSGTDIVGENASTSNKGIASFATADFVVTTGAVDLKEDVAKTFDGDSGTATTALHNIDILGGTGITTLGANNDITISTDDANIDHDSLNNFAANEHFTEASINHANITAGDGSDHADVVTNSAHTAGDGSDHADVLTNTNDIATINGSFVRTNVAGAGIDVSGATGNVTISAEDSTAGNKGIVIVAPGEGMDVSYAAGTATISGEDATTANKGIASFNANSFTVAGGAVSPIIDDAPVNGETNQPISSNWAFDHNADTSIHLSSKTSYWSCAGINFHSQNPDTDTFHYDESEGTLIADGNGITFLAPVQLPHGAVITSVECHGNAAAEAETWYLLRADNNADNFVTMATAAFNTADATINSATVDNQSYHYWLLSTSLDTNDSIEGATIAYTTNYD